MKEIKEKTLKGYKFIDLFAGLGGFRLALESFGAECVYSNEWDKHVRKIYKDNFNDLPDDDITKVDEKSIPDHDILCAGFPCQAFSISGNRKGFEDSRGTLFFDVARVIQEKKPKIIFMENVRNLGTHDHGNTFSVIKHTIEELGYSFNYKLLSANNYGIPQKRERIYMVCFRNDLDVNKFNFPKPFTLDKHIKDIIINDKKSNSLFVDRSDIHLKNPIPKQISSKPLRVGQVNKGGQGERIYSINGAGITLSAYGGGVFSKTGGYLINNKPRKLSPRECARLMGFPDNYSFDESDAQAYKQLGNSVVVDVLQYITQEISNSLNKK